MSRFRSVVRWAVLTFAPVLACVTMMSAEVTVFAAASLTDALKEIGANYSREAGDKVIFNFGASSLLARQIEEGARADIFFSADEAKMDSLESKGMVAPSTRRNRLSNVLVIVVAAERGAPVREPGDLASDQVRRVALAEPNSVPAGVYARQFLEKEKLWSQVAPRVVPTQNVRGVLAAVESGNVEAGIVYRTDAAISRKVKVAYEISSDRGPSIRYPMARMKEGRSPAAGQAFLEYLGGADAGKVFEKYGFIVFEAGQ